MWGNPGLANFVEALGLVDLWLVAHLGEGQYSYASNSMGSMSNRDYFLIPRGQQERYGDTRFLARGISDHSPPVTSLGMSLTGRCPRWRMDPWEFTDWNTRGF